jgi:hypothetical protein
MLIRYKSDKLNSGTALQKLIKEYKNMNGTGMGKTASNFRLVKLPKKVSRKRRVINVLSERRSSSIKHFRRFCIQPSDNLTF